MMGYLYDLLANEMFMAAVISWACAQIIKTVINLVLTRSFDPERLIGSGGMPSSHSAFVTGLATAAFLSEGPGSPAFAICFVLAFVVMYDAMGVRKETGTEAKILNRLRKRDIRDGVKPLFNKPLEEKIGHTLPEVLVGTAIGIVMGIVMCRVSALIP